MGINNLKFIYKGNVKLKLMISDKVVTLEEHNSGLPRLSQTFCNMLIGNPITREDIPEYLDLRYSNDGGTTWTSNLITRVYLSGKSVDYDSEENTYTANFNAVISYNMLQQPIDRNDPRPYRLYLYSGALSADTGHYDLAYLDVSAATLSNISPGTQVIVSWSMQIVNSDE